jgi:hypothetical protein
MKEEGKINKEKWLATTEISLFIVPCASVPSVDYFP